MVNAICSPNNCVYGFWLKLQSRSKLWSNFTLKRRFFRASYKISTHSQFGSKKRWIIMDLINKSFIYLYLSQKPSFTGLFLVSKLLDGRVGQSRLKYSKIFQYRLAF